MSELRLNLGAADRRVTGFVSVDIAPPADIVCDLSGPWPWPNSSVDEVIAMDVCEHIVSRPAESFDVGALIGMPDPRPRMLDGRIHFMNQLHRVLKPGARATVETPNAARGSGYFQDPTHVSPWCLSSFKYFEHIAFARERLGAAYGITARFKVISLTERETNGEDPREKAYKITAILEAVK